MNEITDLQAGKAGEYLVCSDLILKGYSAFIVEQGLPFDVVAELNNRLIKIQVKTTRKQKPIPQRLKPILAYLFNVSRMGKNGKKSYKDSMVDVFALVVLETHEIGYVAQKDIRQSMQFRVEKFRGTYNGEKLIKRRQQIFQMVKEGMKQIEIANALGMNKSYVNRIITGKDILTQGRYLKDFTFENAIKSNGISC